MAWAKNGSTTLSSAGDDITVSSLSSSKLNFTLAHQIASGNLDNIDVNLNSDSGSVYADRESTNGGADSTQVSQTGWRMSHGNASWDYFNINYIVSVSGEEKLLIGFFMSNNGSGSGVAPNRNEHVAKYVPSPDANITSINYNNAGTGDYAIGSNVSVLGSELTPSAIAPETNSIFVETDGGRKYLFDGSEWYLTLKGGSGYATRAVFSGGATGSESNTMDYVTIQTTGNATDFGDLVYARHYVGATSDTSRGVTVGGYGASAYSHIDYYTIATPANAQTFGSLTTGKATYDSCVCDSVNVLQFGGFTGASATATIDYFGIRSLGNASNFGNLATALYAKFGLDDTFRAVTGGGGGYNTVIDYVTMRTPSNSTSFGNLTQGRGWSGATASTTRGVIGGGDAGSISNVIDYVTIQTTGNATDFGDLSVARSYLSATGDRSRGLFGGGSTNYSNGNNTMDYITISTTGNATDFGDLTVARFGIAGCSGK